MLVFHTGRDRTFGDDGQRISFAGGEPTIPSRAFPSNMLGDAEYDLRHKSAAFVRLRARYSQYRQITIVCAVPGRARWHLSAADTSPNKPPRQTYAPVLNDQCSFGALRNRVRSTDKTRTVNVSLSRPTWSTTSLPAGPPAQTLRHKPARLATGSSRTARIRSPGRNPALFAGPCSARPATMIASSTSLA